MKRPRSTGASFAVGWTAILMIVVVAVLAPVIAPHAPETTMAGLLNAPPTVVHVRDAAGGWHAPFINPWRRLSQLEQTYEADVAVVVPLKWFANGRLVQSSDEGRAPLLLLGADSYGRDVFGRLAYGARVSLGLSLTAALIAIFLGGAAGGLAGARGGLVDDVLMQGSEFLLVLPATYAALALRAALPLVLSPSAVFLLLVAIFSVIGAPVVARGVRGIVRAEREQEYAVAAVSLGAGAWRLATRHLLPAATGFLFVQLTLLVPAFIVAEATFSFVGLGFPEPVASWGTMLQEGSSLRALADFPWLLSPAIAMFIVVFGLNLVGQQGGATAGLEPPASF